MMKVKFDMSFGLVSCKRTMTIEVEDDVTDEELDEMAHDWMHEEVSCDWERL